MRGRLRNATPLGRALDPRDPACDDDSVTTTRSTALRQQTSTHDVLNAMDVAVLLVERRAPDCALLFANRAARALLQMGFEEDVTGRSAAHVGALGARFVEAVVRGAPSWPWQIGDAHFDVRLTRPGPTDDIVMCVLTEVTGARRLERELRDAQRAADDANRIRDGFISAVSQEILKPLSPMHAAIESGDDVRTVLRRGVEQMTRIVDDLAFLAELNAGITITPRRIELSRVVEAGVRRAAAVLDSREQTLDIDVPERGLHVDADLDRIAQVIAALLDNAARHSAVGQTIRIAATRIPATLMATRIVVNPPRAPGDTPGDTLGNTPVVALTVEDFGTGIAPEHLVDLFDPYARARRGDRRGRLGLGLFVARRTLELHDGSLDVDSELGRGSRFTLSLPLVG